MKAKVGVRIYKSLFEMVYIESEISLPATILKSLMLLNSVNRAFYFLYDIINIFIQ